MSKNNVNPGHYKVAGRERQGEDIVQDEHKKTMREHEKAQGTGSPNFIPGAPPLGVSRKANETKEDSSQSRKASKK